MTESEIYTKELRPLFRGLGYTVFRVEHERLPDIYLSKKGKCFWCEIKTLDKRSLIIKPDWRPGQLAWIQEQEKNGTKNIFLALWVKNKIYFARPQEKYTLEDLQWNTTFLKNLLR